MFTVFLAKLVRITAMMITRTTQQIQNKNIASARVQNLRILSWFYLTFIFVILKRQICYLLDLQNNLVMFSLKIK